MEYNFREIEQKWQQKWMEGGVYKVPNESSKPKYYVLDMFPYPSGAGLHVGHPLGYIASDIFARYKRLKGFNVLHPMGYDAFGLPAEQYAIEHGVHPAASTEKNIATFRSQLDKIGFSYDWSREVKTSDPKYYKWTQWIFLQLFKSWYNRKTDKAEPIEELVKIFEREGNKNHPIRDSQFQIPEYPQVTFTAEAWNSFPEKTKQTILMEYRLAYCGYGEVNWCEALGTVLANDEVVNGVSERGGHPVVKKKLRQWYLRITEYADRLLKGLETVDFSEAMKEMQTNWIGKSSGAEIDFLIDGHDYTLRVYTTRPDTIFGVDFMVVAPEHDLIEKITTKEHRQAVEDYIAFVKSRSERERMAEKKISGVFTGAYAVNPFDNRKIPVWISEYVLAGYGTGAIMAVPSGDERDHKFARHFSLTITNILGDAYNGEEANPTKDAVLTNSGFITGMIMRDAIDAVIDKLEEMGIGKRKVNYKIRDAAFSRQRYWGEPFPVKWIDGVAWPLDESELPLELPFVESYKPGPEGEGPLANIAEWVYGNTSPVGGNQRLGAKLGEGALETNTMPGYAGSSWYFLRYMDPHNENAFCDKKFSDYWNQVDLYVGGTEHAVGHLLYSRMWTKALYDLGWIGFDEPYKKLLNQGMIQGSSRFVYRVKGTDQYVSFGIKDRYETDELHVDVNLVDGIELDIDAFKKWKPDFADAEFILEDGKYYCGTEVEKMSKRYFNTVNPDDLCNKYGADTFRMYEMFLGPVEMSKPWDTKGIEGVHRFLKKLWRLFFLPAEALAKAGNAQKANIVTEAKATAAELKVLHRTIRKIEEDTERFSYNTAVSAFMVCVNELTDLKCHKREVLEPLLILLAPYAPHISEELWHQLGNDTSILDAAFPKFEGQYVLETTKEYPVSVNGKLRTQINLDLNATQEQVQEIVLANPVVQKWIEGKPVKKFIFVKGKMVNLVV
jgi:leucyl-tRNA synthetase